jgi:NAD(P)-dependent dehydrogenase (short-subunit alcohol dehydrogenase family)
MVEGTSPPVYLVTGGARGIGRAVAEHLSGQGARIVLADNGCLVDGTEARTDLVVEAAAEMCAGGKDVVGLPVDICRRDEVSAAISTALSRWGRLDGAVHAAAILRTGNILSMSADDWNQTLEVNVSGTLNVNSALIERWLLDRVGGRIVNFTSTAGLEGIPDMLAYATSKAAVVGLTLATAHAVSAHGITVNAVAPNASTRMAVRGLGKVALDERASSGKWPEIATTGLPPVDTGYLCGFLLSHLASSITGRVFTAIGRRYGRLALSGDECLAYLPENATQEMVNEMLASSIGADLGIPSRWISADVHQAPYDFPVSDLG